MRPSRDFGARSGTVPSPLGTCGHPQRAHLSDYVTALSLCLRTAPLRSPQVPDSMPTSPRNCVTSPARDSDMATSRVLTHDKHTELELEPPVALVVANGIEKGLRIGSPPQTLDTTGAPGVRRAFMSATRAHRVRCPPVQRFPFRFLGKWVMTRGSVWVVLRCPKEEQDRPSESLLHLCLVCIQHGIKGEGEGGGKAGGVPQGWSCLTDVGLPLLPYFFIAFGQVFGTADYLECCEMTTYFLFGGPGGGGQAMKSCRSSHIRWHSRNVSESRSRAAQCYDCPTRRL